MPSDRLPRLRELLRAQPGDSFLRFALARELQNAGELEPAVEEYARLRASDPDYVGLYFHLAATLDTLGRTDETEEAYRAGIAVAERRADAHALAELRNAYLNWQLERG